MPVEHWFNCTACLYTRCVFYHCTNYLCYAPLPSPTPGMPIIPAIRNKPVQPASTCLRWNERFKTCSATVFSHQCLLASIFTVDSEQLVRMCLYTHILLVPEASQIVMLQKSCPTFIVLKVLSNFVLFQKLCQIQDMSDLCWSKGYVKLHLPNGMSNTSQKKKEGFPFSVRLNKKRYQPTICQQKSQFLITIVM